ncbi:MAG: hypothetical protein DHS20C14_20020 [Phycisphaeraceae bacterium]|nr:MAG: hypothetical protein DHS20C14_20020 [Phycisphaeraceae bacterium]
MTARPTAKPTKTLVISDGSLASLIATAIVSEEAASGNARSAADLGGIVWGVPANLAAPGPFWDVCDRAAGRQADVYGLGYLPPEGGFRARVEALGGLPAGAGESLTLVEAAYTAALHECPRVIWATQAPAADDSGDPDLDLVARAVDRALLASRLVGLDADRPEWPAAVPEVRIETPFVDLRDDELADLARDMRVPVETCWWWGGAQGTPGAADEHARWTPLVGAPRAGQTAEPKPAGSPTPTRA